MKRVAFCVVSALLSSGAAVASATITESADQLIASVPTGETYSATPSQLSPYIGKTVVKEGGGFFALNGAMGVIGSPTRWTVAEGYFQHSGTDLFGNHSTTTTNLVIDVREGAFFQFVGVTHAPFGTLELTGGTLEALNQTLWNTMWGNYDLRGGVTVHACATPSVLRAGRWIHLRHISGDAVIDVESGAVLRVDALLTNGVNAACTGFVPTKLVKRGGGELRLLKGGCFSGGFEVHGGTVAAECAGALGSGGISVAETTTFEVPAGLTVVYADAVSGAGAFVKSGLGRFAFVQTPTGLSALRIEAGTVVVPSYANLPPTMIAAGAGLGVVDFSSVPVARLKEDGTVCNAAAEGSVEALAFDGADTAYVGTLSGTTLRIGRVADVGTLVVGGGGTMTIKAFDGVARVRVEAGTTAHLPEGTELDPATKGIVYFGDSSDATVGSCAVPAEGAELNVPAGGTLTVLGWEASATPGAILKTGAGRLVLPDASNGAYTDLRVEGGSVQVGSIAAFGSGRVVLAGGGLFVSASFTPATIPVTVEGSCTIDVPEGVDFSVANTNFIVGAATVTKTGAGSLTLLTQFQENTQNSVWIVHEGSLVLGRADMFTNHKGRPTQTIEVHEGARLVTTGHNSLDSVTLRGGALTTSSAFTTASLIPLDNVARQSKNVDPLENPVWKPFSFNGTLHVVASGDGRESTIDCPFASLANVDYETVFDVDAGATLRVKALLVDGWNTNYNAHVASPLRKKGAGTLALERGVSGSGRFDHEAGTVVLGRNARFSEGRTVAVCPSAAFRLEDGAELKASTVAMDSFDLLSSAAVWFDAARVTAAPGASVETVPNLGTAGGSFGLFTAGTVNPGAPTCTTDGFNGLKSLAFDGNQALVAPYVQTKPDMTIFLVAAWSSWVNTAGQGRWGGPFSLAPADAAKTDDLTSGAFHLESQDSVGDAWLHFGPLGNFHVANAARGVGTSFLDCIRVSGTGARFEEWTPATETSVSGSLEKTLWLNAGLLSLGGRLGANGSAQWVSSNHSDNRMFIGRIGEFLLFPRVLTDEECARVREYLRVKWLLGMGWLNVGVDVPENARATLVGEVAAVAGPNTAFVRKTGGGALDWRADAAGTGVLRVEAGTLELRGAASASRADVWVDPSDASTVTLENGKVTALANKGRAGGAFGAARGSGNAAVPLPALAVGALNGRDMLEFDGNAALALSSFVVTNEPRNLHVYAILHRTSFSMTPGLGRWGGPFSFYDSAETESDELCSTAFHVEWYNEGQMDVLLEHNKKMACADTNPGEPRLFTAHLDHLQDTVLLESADDAVNAVPAWTSLIESQQAFDTVLLGGRAMGGGCVQWYGANNSNNRTWFGRLGEFIAFRDPLTREEEVELLAYLRAKWLAKGTGGTEPPAFLTGHPAATGSGTTGFAFADGTALVADGPTYALSDLVVEGSVAWTWNFAEGLGPIFSVSGETTFAAGAAPSLAVTPAPSDRVRLVSWPALPQNCPDWTTQGTQKPVAYKADGLYLGVQGLVVFIR